MSCCLRSSKMSSTPSFTHCDWCGTSFDSQLVYLLHTQETGTKSNTTHHVGEKCCVSKGKHADYANRFLDRWGCLPFMNFEFLETPENVTQMFAQAKKCHEGGGSRHVVKSLFRTAWRTYKKLSPENQAKVVTK
jgi:hypothetical protein